MGGTERELADILKAVGLAAAVSICLMCAAAWLVWSLNLSVHVPQLAAGPLAMLVVSYSAVTIVTLGNRDASTAAFAVVFLIGLVVSLLVGGVLSEVIHCSYDRAGCFNL